MPFTLWLPSSHIYGAMQVTPEPPRLATKRAPSVHPPATFRYRVPEPSDGWVVRPHIEHHGEALQLLRGAAMSMQLLCDG